MRKGTEYPYRFEFRVDEWTNNRLTELSTKSKRKKAEVIRSLLCNALIRECPPLEYLAMLKELHYIGHNLNQIATKANTTGDIDASEYKRQAALLREAILQIRRAVEAPEENE